LLRGQSGKGQTRRIIGDIANRSIIDQMQKIETTFIDETLRTWQRRATRVLNREDGREIAQNVCGFFQTLLEWESATHETREASEVIAKGKNTINRARPGSHFV
jgi:hypothetical protein